MITITPELILGFVCICYAIGIYCFLADTQKRREIEEYEKECVKIEEEFNIRLKWKDPVLYSQKETLDRIYDMGRMTEKEYAMKMEKILKYYNAQEVLKEMKKEREMKKKIEEVLENSRDWRNYR